MIKKIEGFEDYYADTEGVIWSYKSGEMKVLKGNKDRGGYRYYILVQNGKYVTKKCHRLVAETFIPNPENKPTVDHINGDKSDNRVENLRWCTQKENNNNPVTLKRLGEAMSKRQFSESHRKKLGKVNSKAVIQYTKEGVFVAEYASTKEAERQTGIQHANISKCCNGKLKSAGGFKWKYT